MKKIALWMLTLMICLGALAPAAQAGEFKGKADGPFISVEAIKVKAYGHAAYYEYLGKGYIPLLTGAKEAGLVVDFGVMEMVTGSADDGNVYIWWASESMDKMQKAQEYMQEKGSELFADEKWKGMYEDMEKVRKPFSGNIARALTWTKVEDSE